jgi:hypothetical protein
MHITKYICNIIDIVIKLSLQAFKGARRLRINKDRRWIALDLASLLLEKVIMLGFIV